MFMRGPVSLKIEQGVQRGVHPQTGPQYTQRKTGWLTCKHTDTQKRHCTFFFLTEKIKQTAINKGTLKGRLNYRQ